MKIKIIFGSIFLLIISGFMYFFLEYRLGNISLNILLKHLYRLAIILSVILAGIVHVFKD